jgi:hypothetical protein|tara:strand:+ start:5172 stop:5603 length:432 start_codon:yes stop_codon:yes gene_type:complete
MGNKHSYKKGNHLMEPESTDIGINIHVIDMNNSHTEQLKFVETKLSKAGTYTYFELSKKLTKIINNNVKFNVTFYKEGTRDELCIPVERNYKTLNERYYKKDNVIDKKRYYDYIPKDANKILFRHNQNMNLVQIIVLGKNILN